MTPQLTHPNRFPARLPNTGPLEISCSRLSATCEGGWSELMRYLPARFSKIMFLKQGATGLDDPHTVDSVKFSELFRDGLNTLLGYSFVFGQEMKQACPMCMSFSRHPSTSDWTEEGQINEGRPRCAQDKALFILTDAC
jgi:hypothetical protein